MSRLIESALYIFICYIFIQALTIEGKFMKQDGAQIEFISKCIVAVASANKFRKQTVIIIGGENKNYYQDILVLSTIKQFSKKYVPQIIVNNIQNVTNIADKYQEDLLIVLYIRNCKVLPHLNTTFNKESKYLLIVNETLNEECEKMGRKLQHYDAIFILSDFHTTTLQLKTTIPRIDRNTCKYDDEVSSTLINTCINGTLEERVIFPHKKPKNLEKCPFNVGMATMYPYSIIENKEYLQNLQPINASQIRGSDLEIVKIISHYFNATLNLYYIYREEESPYLHLEYVPFLLNGSFDACAGGLYRIYGDLVYYSGIYTQQAVIWVYGVERDSKTWQTITTKINGLYIFVLFYFCYSITWILFCNFDHITVSWRNTFLYSWGTLLGTSSLQNSQTWKQKILNISYLILCLHLSAYIGVQLYSFFTIRGPPRTLKTNDEVMESGRIAYLNYDTKFFVEDDKYIDFANTSRNCANFKDCEDKTIANKGLTVIPEGYFYPLQAATAVENEARVLRASENIITPYHEMIVRKDSPFSGKFEKIVKSLFEAGICDRLYLESIGLLIEAKAESANSNIMTNSYNCESGCAITVSQIAGAIYLWIIGCGISFLAFVLEITAYKKPNVQKQKVRLALNIS